MTDRSALPHGRAFELLPWLVNGTLVGAERDAVEAHARTCITCRRELREQQRLHAALRASATDISAEAAFERLDRDLDAATSSRRRFKSLASFGVAAAAGLAVLAVLLWFTPLPQVGDGAYTTLATPPTSAAALLDVVFAEDTTAAQMQALLDEIGGEIVAGPSELGRYSVRVGDDAAARAALAVLARDSRVRFAGRSLLEPQQ